MLDTNTFSKNLSILISIEFFALECPNKRNFWVMDEPQVQIIHWDCLGQKPLFFTNGQYFDSVKVEK